MHRKCKLARVRKANVANKQVNESCRNLELDGRMFCTAPINIPDKHNVSKQEVSVGETPASSRNLLVVGVAVRPY